MKPMERFYPETRFGGFTDIDGSQPDSWAEH